LQQKYSVFNLITRDASSEEFVTVEELRRDVAATRGGVRARLSGYIVQIMDDVFTYRAHLPADGTM
jgi:hypothetical protein